MTLATTPSTVRGSRWRRWWLVIPVVFALVGGFLVVRVVSCATAAEPFTGGIGLVNSVAVGELDGTAVVVGGRGDAVGVWELVTGEPMSGPAELRGGVRDVALGELAGAPVIVVNTSDWQIRVLDLATLEPVGEPIGSEELPLRLAGVPRDGTAVAVVDVEPTYVQELDLSAGRPVGEPIGADAGLERLVGLRVGQVQGREVVAGLDEERRVWVWDLATGEPVVEPFLADITGSQARLALGELRGAPVVVSGGGARPIQVQDLRTGERLGRPTEGRGYLSSLEVGEVDGEPVVVAGHWDDRKGRDELTWVWDLGSGELLTEPFGSLPQWSWQDSHGVNDQAITELEGDPVVVVAHDSKIKVWDLRTGDLLVGHRNRPWSC